jgi:hypothetical protein
MRLVGVFGLRDLCVGEPALATEPREDAVGVTVIPKGLHLRHDPLLVVIRKPVQTGPRTLAERNERWRQRLSVNEGLEQHLAQRV